MDLGNKSSQRHGSLARGRIKMAEPWPKRAQWIVATYFDDNFAEAGRKLRPNKETIRLWANTGQEPGVSELEDILQKCPDVNPTWLVTGRGPRTLPERDADPRVATAEKIRDQLAALLQSVEFEYGLEPTRPPSDPGAATASFQEGARPADPETRRSEGSD